MPEPDHVNEIIDAWRVELPEIAGLPLELAKRTALLNAVFETATTAELVRLGLTPADYGILATLRRIGQPHRMKPTDLTHSLLLSSGGTSNIVRRLVELGYATRELDEQDARSTWVQLTPKGVEIAETAVRAATAAHSRLVERIPEHQALLLSEFLRDALNAMTGEVSASRDGLSNRRRR